MELKYTITIIHTPCTHKQKERVCRNNIDCSLHLWPFFDRQARSRAYRLGKKKGGVYVGVSEEDMDVLESDSRSDVNF